MTEKGKGEKMTIRLDRLSRLRVEMAGKNIDLHCDDDVALGILHDALMMQKGWVVDRMIRAQKEEEEASEMIKVKSDETNKEIVS